MLELVVFGLATWRVASMFVREDGPWGIFVWIRDRVGIAYQNGEAVALRENILSGILSCVWCCSVWVGFFWLAAWLLLPDVAIKIATAFAFSTVAIVIDSKLVSH